MSDAQGPWFAAPELGYFHVRKEDVHGRSATEVNPGFESFDVVLRRDYDRIAERLALAAEAFDTGDYEVMEDVLRSVPSRASHSQARGDS